MAAGIREALPLEMCERLALAMRLLGKRWTGLILDTLRQRPARFSELDKAIEDLSQRVLGARLRELGEAGLVERRVDPGPPVATVYRLTRAGQRLGPALDALRTWADELPP